jgi:hypothetical protein
MCHQDFDPVARLTEAFLAIEDWSVSLPAFETLSVDINTNFSVSPEKAKMILLHMLLDLGDFFSRVFKRSFFTLDCLIDSC